jgi:hypothetical protein
MGRGKVSITLATVLMFMAPTILLGQSTESASVQVRNVRFAYIRQAGGPTNWLEATVELSVRGGAVDNPRFVDSVRVALSLGVRSPLAAEPGFVFYRSEAEASTLESGTARFRFYLPPAVVRRYEMSGEPFAFTVDLWVGGSAVPGGSTSVSTSLGNPEALRSFQDRVAQDAIRNDGILLPQYKTPFLIEYAQDTPAFVRRGR